MMAATFLLYSFYPFCLAASFQSSPDISISLYTTCFMSTAAIWMLREIVEKREKIDRLNFYVIDRITSRLYQLTCIHQSEEKKVN